MFDRITGEILSIEAGAVVIRAGALGLRIEVTMETLEDSEIGIRKSLYLHHSFGSSQDLQLRLYGFESQDARRLFLMLRSVSRIGVSSAMKIMGSKPVSELVQAIADGEAGRLEMKGVGKKTADRIVTELRSKAQKFWSHV